MKVDIPLSYTQQFTEMRHSRQTCNLPYIFQAWLLSPLLRVHTCWETAIHSAKCPSYSIIYIRSSSDYCHTHVTSDIPFSQNSQMLNSITFRSLIKDFTQIRQYRKDGDKFNSTRKQSTAATVPIFTDQQTVVYISCTELYPSRTMYGVRIKYFPEYKHLLQEHYVEYKHISLPLIADSKILCHVMSCFEKKYMFVFHVVFL
jgi:hypothetical protein